MFLIIVAKIRIMLCKTRGIVLHTIPYNDKYSIIYMYTEAFGRASYLVSRSRGKKSTVSKALFIPLSVLEMEVEHLNKRDLHRIKETRICFPLNDVCCDPVKNVFDWKQFLAEYYAEEENPVEALVASEAELAISGSLIHGNEETRTIDFEEQKAENSAETELTPEQKYIQTGKELGYGKDDHDDPSAIEGFEFIDTPAYIDNSQSDTDKDAAEELSEEEVVAGFEFETEKVEPEESYLEDVPMFKQKRLEDE